MQSFLAFIDVLKGHWGALVGLAVFLSGVIHWLQQLYQIRKLRLDIAILKKKFEDDHASPIKIATLTEIQQYAGNVKKLKEIQRFIALKAQELATAAPGGGEQSEDISRGVAALEELAEARTDPIAVYILYAVVTQFLVMSVMLLVSRFFVEWLTTSSSPLAQTLYTFAQILIAAVALLTLGLLGAQSFTWLFDKIDKRER